MVPARWRSFSPCECCAGISESPFSSALDGEGWPCGRLGVRTSPFLTSLCKILERHFIWNKAFEFRRSQTKDEERVHPYNAGNAWVSEGNPWRECVCMWSKEADTFSTFCDTLSIMIQVIFLAHYLFASIQSQSKKASIIFMTKSLYDWVHFYVKESFVKNPRRSKRVQCLLTVVFELGQLTTST